MPMLLAALAIIAGVAAFRTWSEFLTRNYVWRNFTSVTICIAAFAAFLSLIHFDGKAAIHMLTAVPGTVLLGVCMAEISSKWLTPSNPATT
ncbi:hypothetical protein HON52_02680 [Candidatus Uhrbacteria bacterium]|nr:hypothetical protein [Candidatus Uhrbacteria bacterium]